MTVVRDRVAAAFLESLEARLLLTAVVPTNLEQYMVELINLARADPAAEAARLGIDLNEGLAAGTISAAPKQPLAINAFLTDSAREHSRWQIENDVVPNIISHGETPGTPFFRGIGHDARIEAAGYEYDEFPRGASENIAARFPIPLNANLVGLMHDQLFVDEGVAGRGHRKNLMDDEFREIGVGALTGPTNGNTWAIITQNFTFDGDGEPGDDFGDDLENFITGVVFADDNDNDFYTPGEGIANITITATPQGGGDPFVITSIATGGYSLPVPNGTYTVVASGAGFTTMTVEDVVVDGLNEKVDFIAGEAPPQPADILAQTVQVVGGNTLTHGTTVEVKVTLKNNGDTATGAFPVKLFRSTDNALGGDTEIDTQEVANLAAGATTTLTFDVEVDAGITPGSYFFLADADPADAVDESDDTNNGAASDEVTIQAAPDPADIVAESVEVLNGPTFVPGDRPQVRVTLRNDGQTATGAFAVRLSLSTDNQIGGDTQLDEANVNNLAPGGSVTVTFTVVLGDDAPPDDYFFVAQADPDNAVAEQSDDNNDAVTATSIAVAWLSGNVGGRKNVKLTVLDDQDVPVSFLLKGAGQAAVTSGDDGFDVTLTGTDMTSKLTITVPAGSTALIHGITGDGDIKTILAKLLNLNGDITLAGATTKIQFDDALAAAGQKTITIGDAIAALPKPPQLSLVFDEIDELSVDSDTAIKAVTARRWGDASGAADAIEAPAVATVSIKGHAARGIVGDFEADVLAGTGLAGNGKSVNKVTIAGTLRNGSIVGAANVGKVTAGRFENAAVYAGVAAKPGALPGDLTGFGAFTLAGVTAKGIAGGGASFVNSNLGAATVTKVSLKDIDETNGGTGFGVIATTLKKLTRLDDGGAPVKLALPGIGETVDNDFVVRIV